MFVIRERLYAYPVLCIFSSRLKVFHNVMYLLLLLTCLSEGFTIGLTCVGSLKLGLLVAVKTRT